MKLIQIAIKYCKKIISILLITLMLSVPTTSFASEDYKINDYQRETLISQSEVVQWETFDDMFGYDENIIIIDYYSGRYFVVSRMGGGNHADIEPVDAQSTENMKKAVKDGRGKTRPVIILFENGRSFIASSFMVGHAGRDDEPFRKEINNRSNGYGKGTNWDSVKNNNLDGHICLFVDKCLNHYDGKINKNHEENLK
ncbi:hypothetical protein, partial [Romboutsia sp. 1001285H_161024_C4]|uniref:hypothetical protein n=1 Tax=Romboutsia sp. 1001285H_161024_C4 TaxID=2787109 RepID=UPI002ED1F7B2